MIDTTIDKRSISALIRALKRITANGGDLDDGSLWNDSPSRDQFENLKELKAHKESLQRLGKSIEKARFILQLSCNAQHLQSGINDLPVEILSRIFVLSRPPSLAGFDQAMSLSHVCRHFRSVALGELSLWATASLGRPIGQVQICLTRSGSVPLTVVMGESPHYSDVDDDQVVEFLELVTPHAHRWSALHVGKSVQAESTNSVVRTKYPNLHLPLLTKLVQKQPAFIDDPLVSFLATWTTPMLTSYSYFVVENMSPPIAILRSPITRCSIFWTRSLNPFDVDIAAIVRVLATMSALEELEVAFAQPGQCRSARNVSR
ncbi:hypothetical protein BD410DRAFT_118192 [Rickenella mellea]|uniref:F-box domain-containing protein n=1 Tax=Rickenella mellea TaxID=50990 RepID=A0A4Y7Q9K2_9AGAM|nr:hypothetical protein BD410DRAFT_118192 [Rickenella mellea]